MFEKVAEHRSRVLPLAKTSATTSCQNSDGWMFKKTVKWFVEEGWRHSVTTRKASFKTLYTYKLSTTKTNKTPILGC